MKKYLLAIPVLALAAVFIHAQGAGEDGEPSAVSPASYMDTAVKKLAEGLNKKLIEGKAGKITVGQFSYRGNAVPLGSYWVNQLTGELANISGRSYTVLSAGTAGADWTISGEILDTAIGVIRLYTRLIRTEDRAVEASFSFDFERNEQIAALLMWGESGSGGRSSSVVMDALENDSFDNPVPYEIGANENAQLVNRTLHGGDEDFFLLLPAGDGALIMETTGGTDTYMELYNAETREKLGQNDDGGSGGNARIRYNAEAGKRYIAKVRGYDGDTGQYGFRAYIYIQVRLLEDEYEPDNDSASAKPIEPGTPQQHNFHTSNDVDWFKFQITRPGRYMILTRGVNSNRLDTYIELFDSNLNSIDEDDDGGENVDSRLSLRLESGLYYLKVECLDESPNQPYNISVSAEADMEK
ncbi:MAG: PPC domain-containing protein [Treponema sp.]|jgi:hypothetical protein|nr:PPC domain-containing protein [Treponema sp.]